MLAPRRTSDDAERSGLGLNSHGSHARRHVVDHCIGLALRTCPPLTGVSVSKQQLPTEMKEVS